MPRQDGENPRLPRQDRFPAREAERIGRTRTWDASQESLRNFTCKDAEKGTALQKRSLASSGVSLRALSGASCDASEEVSVFRPRRYLERSASSQEDAARRRRKSMSDSKRVVKPDFNVIRETTSHRTLS